MRIGLLPMKGHSARVPNKNLRLLHGRPLFWWVLDALSASDTVCEIIINTDSEEIAQRAREWGEVTIHERPLDLCGDFVEMNRIIAYDLSCRPDTRVVVQTHATNPLLRPATLREAVRILEADPSCDSVFTVTRLQARLWDANGVPVNHDPKELQRTQDLPPIFLENSCVYVCRAEAMMQTGRRIGTIPRMLEMSPHEAVDIDTETDWRMAELLMASTAPSEGSES